MISRKAPREILVRLKARLHLTRYRAQVGPSLLAHPPTLADVELPLRATAFREVVNMFPLNQLQKLHTSLSTHPQEA